MAFKSSVFNFFLFAIISCLTFYPSYIRVGKCKLVLRHSVLPVPQNFRVIVRLISELDTVLCPVVSRIYHLFLAYSYMDCLTRFMTKLRTNHVRVRIEVTTVFTIRGRCTATLLFSFIIYSKKKHRLSWRGNL